jgi:hypothetical protein
MKSLINTSLVIIAIFSLWSCRTSVPITQQRADNNRTYEIDYLFEHDGCKVYRFRDNGEYVYFTNCNGQVSTSKGDSSKTQTVNLVKRE